MYIKLRCSYTKSAELAQALRGTSATAGLSRTFITRRNDPHTIPHILTLYITCHACGVEDELHTFVPLTVLKPLWPLVQWFSNFLVQGLRV